SAAPASASATSQTRRAGRGRAVTPEAAPEGNMRLPYSTPSDARTVVEDASSGARWPLLSCADAAPRLGPPLRSLPSLGPCLGAEAALVGPPAGAGRAATDRRGGAVAPGRGGHPGGLVVPAPAARRLRARLQPDRRRGHALRRRRAALRRRGRLGAGVGERAGRDGPLPLRRAVRHGRGRRGELGPSRPRDRRGPPRRSRGGRGERCRTGGGEPRGGGRGGPRPRATRRGRVGAAP